MKEQDKARFKLAMHLFEITFSTDFDNARLSGFFMALEDLSIESIELAAKEIVKAEKRSPVPATIREYTNRYRKPVDASHRIAQYSMADVNAHSALGKDCVVAIRKLFSGEIDKKEYLLEAARIADRHNQPDMTEWIDQQWEELHGKTETDTLP